MIKDKSRRNDLACHDLARQYRTKANELETKHQQLTQLHSEFETKAQQKEVHFLFLPTRQLNNRFPLGRRKSH